MSSGYNKLYRKWTGSEMARDPNATVLFMHIICNVRWEPKENRRYGYTVERGEWDVTREQLASATGLSVSAVRAALERLKRYGTIEIRQVKGRVPSIIKLCNYADYQGNCAPEQPAEQPVNDRLTTGSQPVNDHSCILNTDCKQNEQKEDSCSEPQAAHEHTEKHPALTDFTQKPTPNSPPWVPPEFAGLELYAADSKLCARWDKLLPAWREAYPGVDVVAEVRKAHAWEVSNPKKRKVNRAPFLVNWLSRAQDKPQLNGKPPPRKPGQIGIDLDTIDYEPYTGGV